MKKHFAILSLLSCGLLSVMNANADEFTINGYHHPPKEPKGLYIVNFDAYNGGVGTDYYMSLTYRVYCPTKTVRDISEGKMGVTRTAIAEDKAVFGGQYILRGVVKQVCK